MFHNHSPEKQLPMYMYVIINIGQPEIWTYMNITDFELFFKLNSIDEKKKLIIEDFETFFNFWLWYRFVEHISGSLVLYL